MTMLRYGDPYKYPETDIKFYKGARFVLDTIWLSGVQARQREKQLEDSGRIVTIFDRMAPPEEVHQHLDNIDIDGSVYKDGRFTRVWEVWVKQSEKYRKRKYVKPNANRKSTDITDDILNLTKAGVVGVVGMGLVGAIGAMARKKRKTIPKRRKKVCKCKK